MKDRNDENGRCISYTDTRSSQESMILIPPKNLIEGEISNVDISDTERELWSFWIRPHDYWYPNCWDEFLNIISIKIRKR